MNRKKAQGALHLLPASAISVVFLVIVVALGVLIMAGMNASLQNGTGYSSNPAASTVITQGVTGLGVFGSWFNTIVIVIIAVVIISLLTGFFYAKGKGVG